jgi:predicted transcriptional regulator
MKKEKTIRVGIMSKEQYKKRTIAIAKGEYIPKKDEPKVWFESIGSMSQILSSQNQELLKIIIQKRPQSLKKLEELTCRAKPNLSRTLNKFHFYKWI